MPDRVRSGGHTQAFRDAATNLRAAGERCDIAATALREAEAECDEVTRRFNEAWAALSQEEREALRHA